MYVLTGWNADSDETYDSLFCLDGAEAYLMDYRYDMHGRRVGLEEASVDAPIFLSERAANAARVKVFRQGMKDEFGRRFVWYGKSVVQLDTAKVKALIDSDAKYREAFVAAIQCGERFLES